MIMLTAFYNSQQLSALLIPPKKYITTNIDHLEADLLSGHLKTAFMRQNGSLEVELKSGNYTLARQLQTVWQTHPPLHIFDTKGNADAIKHDHTMVIDLVSNVYAIFTHLDPRTCGEYELINLIEVPPQMIAIAFRPDFDQLDDINSVVDERRNWARRLIDSSQVDPICREHLFPSSSAQMHHNPLDLYTLSGIFVALIVALGVACAALVVELCVVQQVKEIQHDKRHLYINAHVKSDNLRACREWKILLQMIEQHNRNTW